MSKNDNLIFVDVEASGPTIGKGEMTEFGAVHYTSMETFYGNMKYNHKQIFEDFDIWLKEHCDGRPVFISDNPAFDWMWINFYFHHLLDYNPFGWSGRRISDYYAGLKGNFWNSQAWKKLRITKHTHFPVDDAMGNAEAFKAIEEDRINRMADLQQELDKKADYLYIPKMEDTNDVNDIR